MNLIGRRDRKVKMMKNWNWKSVGGTCTCTISNGNEIKEYEFPSSLFDFVTDSCFSDGQRIIYFIGGLLLRTNCDMGINKCRVVGEEKKKKRGRGKKNTTKDCTTEIEGWKITLLSCIAVNCRNALYNRVTG